MQTKEEISDQSPHIPDDILLEIIIKLPPKSVFRFRCVSKSWLSLISHSSFSPFYFSRSNYSLPFALVSKSNNHRGIHFLVTGLKNFSSPFPCAQIPGLKIEATSNDLILYRSNKDEYYVANPFTGQRVTLPVNSGRTNHGPTGLISYARNGITNYYVVCLIKHRNNCLNLETFSSEKGEWKDITTKSLAFDVARFTARPCVVFKDIIHLICDKTTALWAYDPFKSPDDDDDRCRFIGIPCGAYDANGMNAILGVSCGNLCYFEVARISMQEFRLPGWKLWVLKDYESGEWSLEREIEGIGVVQGLLSKYSPFYPSGVYVILILKWFV